MHPATNYCLFDDCEDRRDFSKSMRKPEICVDCLAKLDSAGIGHNVIREAKAILRYCRRSALEFAVSQTLRNPLTTLSLGTATGWLCKTLLSRQDLQYVLISAAAIPLLVFLKYKFRSR